MTGIGDQLLATRVGATFLACGAAVGRLDEVLADPGLTLCLAAHALAEVRRGTDQGRIRTFVERPGEWLRDAARTVDGADVSWWSTPATDRVLRQTDDHTTGIELLDSRGRRRSGAEEAAAHLHTFSSRQRVAPPRRLRLGAAVAVDVLDGPQDATDELRTRLDGAGDEPTAIHLTLRGALTVDRDLLPRWPWAVDGIHWPTGVPSDDELDEPFGPEPRVVHDYGWPPIGRPYDPRFDEGDEVDGSELEELGRAEP